MSDDFDDDSLSESEALLEQEPRDVDLSNAVANWWLFMEYNQSLWPKDKKELLHLLNSFTHVQHQFSTDQIKLFLFSTKILQMDLQDQQVHFNKENLVKYDISEIVGDIKQLEKRMQFLKANPDIIQELMSGNITGLKDREERIIDGDKKVAESDLVDLSDFELELRRVSFTRVVVWLKHHQAELDAMKEHEVARLLPIIGLVPIELQPEDIFDELVQQRLISASDPLKIRVEPVQLQLNDSAARSIFKSVLYSFLTFLMFWGVIREFGSILNMFRGN